MALIEGEDERREHMPNYWLIVERFENWEVDKENLFAFFGIPDHKRALAERIAEGDQLITYISSGIASFADVRQARSGGFIRLRHGGDYDTAFGLAIPTEPVVVLPRNKWLPINTFVECLDLTRGKKDWRQVVRQSLRSLSVSDGKLLKDRIKRESER